MRTIISNKIEIENPTPDILAWCEESLVLDNPEFYKLQRLGKWTGRTPQEIVLYERKGDSVLLPFGCLQDVWGMIKDCEYKVEISPVRNVGYDTNINLYSYQKKAIESALKRKNGILVMPCGSGKGLPLDAKIYTPDGWVRNGDLHVGDKVIGANGESTIVTGVFDKGVVDAYKITFSDNTEVICDKDHLWAIQKKWERTEKRPYRVMSTEDIFKHYKNITRSQLLYIPIVEPVKFKAKKVKMNPWLLGFLLGDGCFGNTITFSTSEKDILDKVKNTTMNTFRCRGGYDYAFRKGEIYNSIKEIGLLGLHSYEKYIPKIYKYNSINVRLSILQGLFDADGYTSGKGLYEYSTSSITLANDFVEIVESLGGTAKIKEKIPTYTYKGEKRKGRKSYRIFFKLYKFVPFTSKKHKSAYYKRTKYSQAYRIIKKIEKHKPIKSRCISVDAQDNLYVTNHFIVTHNTQVALDLITRVGGRALWLTHTQDLLNQSFNRAKSTIDSEGTFGKITAGKIDVGTAITFATIQTISKIDLTDYKDYWDVIVCDECAHTVGGPTKVTQFYKVLSNLTARYKIGLTATPKRADGLERAMFALLGNTIYTVTRDDVKDTTCPIRVQTIQTGYMPEYNAILLGDGTLNYNALVTDLIKNEERFNLVRDTVNSLSGSALVLANRVDYIQRLAGADVGKAVCLSTMGQSKKAKAERKEVLRKLNDGEIDTVYATYQLAKEGLDAPNLRYVVFATPEKDETTVVQSVGRVGRKADGKDYGTVIDFVDSFGMYIGWSKKRQRYYKKLGVEE